MEVLRRKRELEQIKKKYGSSYSSSPEYRGWLEKYDRD